MRTVHKGKRVLLQTWLRDDVGGRWVPTEMELAGRYYRSHARARSMAKAGSQLYFLSRFPEREMAKKGLRTQ